MGHFCKKTSKESKIDGRALSLLFKKRNWSKSQLAGHKYEKGSKGGQGMKNITDATELSR
jgi:hypothetical protein